MSLRAVVDVAVQFESFRNIDLFHQGVYHLRARLKHESGGDEWTIPVPYGHNTTPVLVSPFEAVKPKPRLDHHNLIAAQLLEEQAAFVTRSFLIRYCEEEVEINDLGRFRMEMEPRPGKQDPLVLLLQVDLMFADLAQHGGAECFGEQTDVSSLEFTSVSSQTFRVHGANNCLHEFHPVVFDEFHFCVANMVVQTALLDVRFRLWPSLVSMSESSPLPSTPAKGSADAADSQNQIVCAADSAFPQCGSWATRLDGTQSEEDSVALSLMECIFGSGVDKEEPDSGAWRSSTGGLLLAAESFCQAHLRILSKSHRDLKAWLKELCDHCLAPAQRDSFVEPTKLGKVEESRASAATFDSFLSLLDNQMLPVHPAILDPEYSDLAVAKEGSISTLINIHNGHGPELRLFFTAKLGGKVTAQALAALISYNMNLVSMEILSLWQNVLHVVSFAGRESVALLKRPWEQRVADRWKRSLVRQVVGQDLGAVTSDTDIERLHDKSLRDARQSRRSNGHEASIEEVSQSAESFPTVLEQRYASRSPSGLSNGTPSVTPFDCRPPSAPKGYRGLHLFVLVHGFQGNSFDMRLMKNNLAMIHPEAVFLVSNVNEDNTEGDFNEMGIRLAQEVANFICDWCPSTALGRLSFVSYSMGGLILRAALPLLKDYKDKMFTFISFSCPHMGFMDLQSSAFFTVVWALRKWRKIRCLDQLTMTDAKDPKETFLYRLSSTGGLEDFKWIVLVSSKQDNYAPYKSSRVETSTSWDKQPNKEAYAKMVQNFWKPIKPDRVLRLGVHFDLPERSLDQAIGRAAHIKFIENQSLMRMIIHTYNFLFR